MDLPAQHYEYNSPWLAFERKTFSPLSGDAVCEVAVVGGGISGIVTLYYLLTETDKQVMLFEQEEIAAQATGNNAGLACVHIERPIQELVEEYGLEKTRQSFLEIDGSWELMLSILDTIGANKLLTLLPNISLAMTSKEVLLGHIEREKYNRKFGRAAWHYYIADNVELDTDIEVHRISKEKLLEKLHIIDKDFIGVAVPQEELKLGRLNSAKFCFLLLDYLSLHYPNRFAVYEHTPITAIEEGDQLVLSHKHGKVSAQDVLLCTNGYKNFEIIKKSGEKVERLQKALTPREGYMVGFTDPQAPYAQAFFDDRGLYEDSPYFYLSHIDTFTVLGGPEFDEPDGHHDEKTIAKRAKISQEIYRKFLKNTYNKTDCNFSHSWYGIMGYTANGVRWVGEEPDVKHLWYNLGCNGIGITTSIGAAKRVVALLQGNALPPSLFDIDP